MVSRARSAALACGLLVCACEPSLEDRSALIEAPRVIAVRAIPAEAAPGEAVMLEALFAAPPTQAPSAALGWGLCTSRKPLTEQGAIDVACLGASAEEVLPLGVGPGASVTLPDDACRKFGPETPPQIGSEPTGRPVDADLTGGYYQPGRVLWSADGEARRASFEIRLACDPAGVTQAQSAELRRRYTRNNNPQPSSLVLRRERDASLLSEGQAIAAGERLTISVRWPMCSSERLCEGDDCTPSQQNTGCTGAEIYVMFDPTRREVVEQRESMRVSWFASDGHFASDRTGVSGDEQGAESQNVWTAPDVLGPVRLWVVLRDDRGGVGWLSAQLDVAR